MDRENPHMIYLVITKFEGRYNKIVAAKALRHRGYLRLGNGYFYLPIRNNVYPQEVIDVENEWFKSQGMLGKVVTTMKGLRTRYSPYSSRGQDDV